MSSKAKSVVFLMCMIMVLLTAGCGGGGGGLVDGMLDANQTLQDTSNGLTDSGWLK